MAAAAKTVAEMNNILGGNGVVDLSEALAALAGATGLVMLTKKIGLWPRFNTEQQHEIEMLDDNMPISWWNRLQQIAPAAIFSGSRLRWGRGRWDIGVPPEGGDLYVTTPVLDEESDTLI